MDPARTYRVFEAEDPDQSILLGGDELMVMGLSLPHPSGDFKSRLYWSAAI